MCGWSELEAVLFRVVRCSRLILNGTKRIRDVASSLPKGIPSRRVGLQVKYRYFA